MQHERPGVGRRAWIWPVLLLVHLALLAGWRWSASVDKPAQRVSVWILSEHKPHAANTEASVRPSATRDKITRTPAATTPGAASNFNPEAITLAAPPPDLPASAPPAQPRLNLALPPRSASQAWAAINNPAVNDPRSNSPRLTFGERMAEALGTDQSVKVIELQNGGKRIRQGNSCYQTAPSRTAELNPMDDYWRNTPGMAGSCPH